jgi:hypothetical protein
MLEFYPRNLQLLEPYLFTFYEQGGGDLVVITTTGGVYITSDLVGDDANTIALDLLKQHTN